VTIRPATLSVIAFSLIACAQPKATTTRVTRPPENTGPLRGTLPPDPAESRFADLRQLTFGGENAEAYWSFDGRELVFQAHRGDGCDQIYRLDPFAPKPEPRLVSQGLGATTCAFFFPDDRSILYASTELSSTACPPKPDRSHGYVWAIYPSYDIFATKLDGSTPTRLTDTNGYDAEATVCAKDGSIVFTSVRDDDLELYRMDADGKNVRRLTNAPGYDGGAFFSADCTKLVWRASRPRGKELEEYRALLKQGLVRPGQLELMVANADGSDARQITYLGGASFAPFFFPSGKRVIFSSNYADPKGREFDLFAVDTDGTDLERITYTPGFDGFPMFSPDGRYLAFASNRSTAPGSHDTNLFVASWSEGGSKPLPELGADRVRRDVAWLSARERDGRGLGSAGLEAAGSYVEQRFRELGLGVSRQTFEVTTALRVAPTTSVTLGRSALAKDAFRPLGFSAKGKARGRLVLAGHGLVDSKLGLDDYRGITAKGAIVVVRRFVPEVASLGDADEKRALGDLRRKVWLARERGAKAVIVVDAPIAPPGAGADWVAPDEAPFPPLRVDGPGDAGIPVVIVERTAFSTTLAALEKGRPVNAELDVELEAEKASVFNVVAKLAAPGSPKETIVLGAHYDHLGRGGHPSSLAPDSDEPHLGADDNASGVAALMEAARLLAADERALRRNVILSAFTAEETGALGSSEWVKHPPSGVDVAHVEAMLNFDMVGRLRDNRLTVLGTESAKEWPELVTRACDELRVECNGRGDGYGPSDQTPFYAAGVPVLHFFSGAHEDYHKPSDSVDRINAAGLERTADIAVRIATELATSDLALTYQKPKSVPTRGDARSFNASLGTIPDYAGPPAGQPGVLLAGVRSGGAADRAGLARGDILIRLGTHDIVDVRDLMYALGDSKPGDTVVAVVLRAGKKLERTVTLQESRRQR
jgi:Tol biopolymer transport system component